MPNSREFDHRLAGHFNVEIEGVTQSAFTQVLGLQAVTDVHKFSNGNDPVVRKRPGRSRYDNIVLRRGFTGAKELFDWYMLGTSGITQRKSGSIILLGDDGQTEVTRFNFFEAWPCRWRSFDLAADSEAILLEEIEIAFERLEWP